MNSIEKWHICRTPRWLTLGNHQKGFSFFISSIREERQKAFSGGRRKQLGFLGFFFRQQRGFFLGEATRFSFFGVLGEATRVF